VSVRYENPAALLGRLRLGREEYCQRLLTMLILGGSYPRWNTWSTPTHEGTRFLQALDERCFGQTSWHTEPIFVDEFELPKRHAEEAGCAPDYAVLWPNRVWLIELKTEASSHRHDQIPSYLDLAHHHYPSCPIDMTYLTPPLRIAATLPGPWARITLITWDDVAPLLRDVWGATSDPAEALVLNGLLDALSHLDQRPADWRARAFRSSPLGTPAATTAGDIGRRQGPSSPEPFTSAMGLAQLTSEDGVQRAVEYQAANLDELLQLLVAVREAICSSSSSASQLRHVQPWLWRAASGGNALTDAGMQSGYELRLSRYAKPVC
jgi:hypothetical protein